MMEHTAGLPLAENIEDTDDVADATESGAEESGQEALGASDGSEVTAELLDALEKRWQAMADALRDLQQENVALRQSEQTQQDQVADLNQRCNELEQQASNLRGERKRTIDRLESLLSRFDELEQPG